MTAVVYPSRCLANLESSWRLGCTSLVVLHILGAHGGRGVPPSLSYKSVGLMAAAVYLFRCLTNLWGSWWPWCTSLAISTRLSIYTNQTVNQLADL